MRNIAKKATQITWTAEAYKSAGDEDQFIIDYFDKKEGGYLIDIAAACPVSGSLSFKFWLIDLTLRISIFIDTALGH